jgi:DNA helicase-2/ATP-dependent DNA helicase PcrA
LEDGILPHSRSAEDFNQMEEERRLFYVGITRAMQRLYLVHAFRRGIWGASKLSEPSPFVKDIPTNIVKLSAGGSSSLGSLRPAGRTGSTFGSAMSDTWAPVRPAPRTAAMHRELDEMDELDEPEPTPPPRVITQQQFTAGDRVIHPSFGEGVIVSSRMTGDDEQVEVLFKGNVTKKLSMAFAPLQRV